PAPAELDAGAADVDRALRAGGDVPLAAVVLLAHDGDLRLVGAPKLVYDPFELVVVDVAGVAVGARDRRPDQPAAARGVALQPGPRQRAREDLQGAARRPVPQLPADRLGPDARGQQPSRQVVDLRGRAGVLERAGVAGEPRVQALGDVAVERDAEAADQLLDQDRRGRGVGVDQPHAAEPGVGRVVVDDDERVRARGGTGEG